MNIFGLPNWNWIRMTKWARAFFIVACACAAMMWMPDALLRYLCLDGFIRQQSGVTTIGRIVGIVFVLCSFACIVCLCVHIIQASKKMYVLWQESLQWKGGNAKKKILDLSITAKKNIRAKFEQDRQICLPETSAVLAELLKGDFVIPAIKINPLGKIECELKPWVRACLDQYPNLTSELPLFEEWED